jgi:hypothetical protein
MNNQDQQFEAYVPLYDAIPDKWEDAQGFITEQFKRIANAINVREIGWFLDEELLSGKQFIPAAVVNQNIKPLQVRSVFRKVVDFGPLPNTGIKSVAHGINFDNNFTLIQMFASATNPSTSALPIPFASQNAGETVKMNMDTMNINITTFNDRTAFTRCFVVIEYILEV